MKRFEKVQERIQKYSIRKLSVGVGSVAIAALIFGSSLSSSTVAADEVGGGATAHYTYVEEQELTEQEKGLIKKGLPENLQTGENYYLIYRKQDGQAVLPSTGNNGQPLLSLFAGTAILAVLVFSRKKSGKLLGVLLLGSLGQTVLQSPQAFALENRELLSYNRQVAVSSAVSEADVTIAGYNYIGYFTASDLRTLTETKTTSLPAGQEAQAQAEVSEAAKEDSDSIDRAAQAGLQYQLNPDESDSGQIGNLPTPAPTPNPSLAPQPSNPPIETAKGESLQEPALPEYSGAVNGESLVQAETPVYTAPVGTVGDTAPVEPALPEYTGGVNGESLVQADNPVYDAPVATVSDVLQFEPALPEYTGGVNGESTVQPEQPSLHTDIKLETIEPQVVNKTDDSKYLDEEATVDGTPGQKEIVTSYEVLDGNRISEPQTTERILHEAVDTVVTRGSKARINKEELSKQLALAAAVDPGVYTNQSYQQLQAIKNMAATVYQTSSSQDEIDAGVNQLKQALSDLLALKAAPTLTVSAVKKDELQKSVQIQYQLTDRDQAFTSAHVRLKKDGQLIAKQNLAAGQLTASFSGLDYYTPYKIETTLSYDLGNGSESQELAQETVQLDLKKVELKSITNVALMKVENGQTKLMPTLAEKPANLDQYYLHFTSDQFKDTVLPVTSIEEVVVDNQPVFKIQAQLPDLLQRSATGLQNSFDFYHGKG